MGRNETKESLGVLNAKLFQRYETGDPVVIEIFGRPKLHVESFAPLVYEKYGTFRNRPPQVNGSVVLRAFLDAPIDDNGVIVYAGVEAGSKGYGFVLDSHNPQNLAVIEDVAHYLGYPDFVAKQVN